MTLKDVLKAPRDRKTAWIAVGAMLAALLAIQSGWPASGLAADKVETFRRQYGSTPSSGWAPALNIVIGSVTALKKGARPWRINVRSTKGFEYNMIVGRGSAILVGRKKISETEFIRRVQLGDRVHAHFTNNKDGDLITRFIEILPASGDEVILEPKVLEGYMKAYMLGREPKIQIRSTDGAETIIKIEGLTIVRSGEDRVPLTDFLKNIATTRNLRVEYVVRGSEKFSRVIEVLGAPSQAPAASSQDLSIPADRKSVEGFLKAYQAGTRPNLLVQDSSGAESVFSIGVDTRCESETGEIAFEDFFKRLRDRRFRALHADLVLRGSEWQAEVIRALPDPNRPIAKNQEVLKVKASPRPSADKIQVVSGHVKAFMGGAAPRLLIVDADGKSHNAVIAEGAQIRWREKKLSLEELFVKVRSHHVRAELADQGQEKVAYSIEVI